VKYAQHVRAQTKASARDVGHGAIPIRVWELDQVRRRVTAAQNPSLAVLDRVQRRLTAGRIKVEAALNANPNAVERARLTAELAEIQRKLIAVGLQAYGAVIAKELDLSRDDLGLEEGLVEDIERAAAEADTEGNVWLRSIYGRSFSDVSVVSVHMGSPLEVVLEIPAVLWSGVAIGLLALAERITTMPVRIARKRKEELLKTAVIDKQIELVNEGRADVLAEILLEEGPRRRTHGPDEVVFTDPDDPHDKLEAAAG